MIFINKVNARHKFYATDASIACNLIRKSMLGRMKYGTSMGQVSAESFHLSMQVPHNLMYHTGAGFRETGKL